VLSRAAAALAFLSLLATSSMARAEAHEVLASKNAVWVDGAVHWQGRKVTSPIAWSDRGDAFAFAAVDQRGRARLVVVVVHEGFEPATFSWPISAAARPARAVTWLGETRVGTGPSVLEPRMIAEFTLETP